MDSTVFSVVHMFSERGISAVPILDDNGIVVNLFETVDVIVGPFFSTPFHFADSLHRNSFAQEATPNSTSLYGQLLRFARQSSQVLSPALVPIR